MTPDALYYLGVKAILVGPDDRILLLDIPRATTPDRYWDLPGGRVKDGEDPIATLRREILEETSLTAVTIGRQLTIALTPARLATPTGATAGLMFAVHHCTTSQATGLRYEPGVKGKWCTIAEAVELLATSPNVPPELIEAVRNMSDIAPPAPIVPS